MRSDVLDVISSARDVTNAVVLTHNIDFVFVQTVVLSAFRRCGYPTITIFADSGCAAESFLHQKGVLTDLGVRFRVVPVAMGTGFRFHPKAVLLTGTERGTLLVGSGNLTFGGWRENGEVWTHFESDTDGPGPFRAFRDYLADVIKRVALPEAVEREVEEAFDPRTKAWMSAHAGTDSGALVGRVGSGPPLLEQMVTAGGEQPVEELLVCAPYFDHDGVALQELVASVGASRATVLCQAGRTALHKRAWEPNAANATRKGIDFRRAGSAEQERSAFVHAKFYGLRRADNVVVLAGSANCSKAALTVGGNVGNAELMVARSLTPQAFEEEFLGELDISSEPVVLAQEPPDDAEAVATGASLHILAARFEAGCLLVGYQPSSSLVSECLVDGETAPFKATGQGVVSVTCSSEPKLVTLRARIADAVVESEPAWIDLERRLRATAHSRSLADSVRARIQAGPWGPDGWAEVLDVFCKHLSYMPVVGPGASAARGAGGVESDGLTFTAADVFAANYRAPKLDRVWFPSEIGGDGRVHSLQQLLLRWFGVEPNEPEERSHVDSDDADREGDEVVDRPEDLPSWTPCDEAMTERNRRRIARIVDQIEAAMTSPEFLAARSPDYLATDLKVASVLFGAGLGKSWMDRERFFELTHVIWSSLFFARPPGEGWLERRANAAEDRDAFVQSMVSADLSAALIGWYLAALTPDIESPEAARFKLAAALAVARLPWLWHGGGQEGIEKELAILLAHTSDGRLDREERTGWAEAEWTLLTQRGQALRCLEAAIRGTSLEVLRDRISTDELLPGDVLWQGNAGFCVVLRRCSRSGKENVPVLKLQGKAAESAFAAFATVPVRALLDEAVIPRTPDFGDVPRRVLREFIGEISSDVLRQS
ncbi:MAG: hypothetical protein OXP09_18735 [Gammaproteobacteria bacterium]|nr:hypothetical protein [Gammaproteobacteria bacterium]